MKNCTLTLSRFSSMIVSTARYIRYSFVRLKDSEVNHNNSFTNLCFAIISLVSFSLAAFGQTTQTFSTPGTYIWLCPPGVTSITVECWGGGGGGGGVRGMNTSGQYTEGGGGAGGGYVKNTSLSVTPGTAYTIVVGAGASAGAGGTTPTAGGKGGDSYFGSTSTVLAIGGNGGAARSTNGSALGGSKVSTGNVGASGSFSYYGGGGGTGTGTNSGGGGGSAGTVSDGNDASGATGGTAVTGGVAGVSGVSSSANGTSGNSPGGGASGGRAGFTSTHYNGGAGGTGRVIVTINTPSCIPLWQQDFANSIIANYYSATSGFSPSFGQFNSIASADVTINSNQLRMVRSSTARWATRTANFSPEPTAVMVSFDLSMSGGGTAVTGAFRGYLGDGLPTSTTAPSTTHHSGFGVDFAGTSNQWKISNLTTAGSNTYSTSQPITWVVNNSGASITYRAPDGTNETVANDRWDLWVGSTKELDEQTAANAARSLFNVELYTSGGSTAGTFDIDNLLIAPVPAIPTSSAATSVTSTGFTANWGAVTCASGYRLDVSTASDFSSFVTGYNNLDVGNVTTYAVSGLSASTTYYYRVRAYNTYAVGTFTSANSGSQNLITNAPATITLGSNAPSAASICSGTAKVVLQSFSLAVTAGDGNLTNVGFTTTGDYVQGDIAKYQLWYRQTTNDISGAIQLGSDLSSAGGAGARTFTAFTSPTLLNNSTYYFWITADIASSISIQRTIAVNGIATSDLTSTSSKAGSQTAAGGTITITADNTAGAASGTPTLCINTALSPDITHTTTGATGIGTPTGLPTGVTALWASNTITINGSPTVDGTFNYSIPLTGGCGNVNATGTITVTPLPSKATTPSPGDGATGVLTNAQLGWSNGGNASSYDVYFGTSSPGIFQGNQAGTSFNPGTLNNSQQYYWRIDAVNSCGTTTGDVWSFQTVSAACVPPTLDAQYNSEQSKNICLGDAYTLSANPSGAANCGTWEYAWYTSDGTGSTYWDGTDWDNAETYGAYSTITGVAPSATTTYKVKVRCTAETTCNNTDATGVTVTVNDIPVAPNLSSATPVSTTAICAGYNSGTVTGAAGTGGGPGAADEYQLSIDGGSSWSAYTSGSAITTTGATGSIIVQARRTGGTGCTTTSWSTICTWTLGTTPSAPTLSSASPANGSVICAGYNSGTVTGTGGSGGSTGSANEYQVSIDGGSSWSAYTSGNTITTTGATGSVIVQGRRTGGSFGCSTTGWSTLCTWTIGSTPSAPTLSSASPAGGSVICVGYNSGTVTGTGGSGGSTGSANEYQVSIDGGSSWSAYTSGNTISTTGATGSVIVQGRRTDGSFGCSTTGWSTLCTWTLGSTPVAPTLGSATPANGSTICAGTNVSATGSGGSGGSTGSANEYQVSIDGGSSWSAYTSGNPITTTGATGSVIVQARRTGGSFGCSTSAWSTIASWPVGAVTTYYSRSGQSNPTILTNWTSNSNGTGCNPANFTDATNTFIIQTGHTYTMTSNWTVSGTVDVQGTLTVNNTAATSRSFSVGSLTLSGTMTIDGASATASASTVTVSGDFTQTAGSLDMNAAVANGINSTMSVAGNFTQSSGSITESGGNFGTLVFNKSGAQTYSQSGTITNSITFQINSGSDLQLNSNLTFSAFGGTGNKFVVNGTLTFGNAARTVTIKDIQGTTGTINMSNAAHILDIASGNATFSGTFNAGTNGTVKYSQSANQTMANWTYCHLTIEGSSGNKTFGSAFNSSVIINGNLFVNGSSTCTFIYYTSSVNGTSGTLSVGGNISVTGGSFYGTNNISDPVISVTGDVNITGGGFYPGGTDGTGIGLTTLNLSGSLTVSGSGIINATYASSPNPANVYAIINFIGNGSGVLSLSTGLTGIQHCWDISIASGCTITLQSNIELGRNADFTVDGTLICGTYQIGRKTTTTTPTFTLNSGATLSIGSVDGITSNGTATSVGNVCQFDNSGSFIKTFNTGANYIYNGSGAQITGTGLPVTVNNLTINNSAGLTLTNSAVTVNGTLLFSSGKFNTGSNKVIISATGTVSGANASKYVDGNLQKNISTGSNISRSFEIGDANNYTPVSLAFASVSTTGDITSSTTAGDHLQISASNLDPAKSVNRFWTLDNSGVIFSTYDVTFNYVSGDLDGSANTSNFVIGKYDVSTWSYPSVGTRTATSMQATGINSFSAFIVAEQNVCVAPSLNAQYNAEESKTICAGASFNLTANPTGASGCGEWEYAWYTGTGNDNSYWNGSTWTNAETYGAYSTIASVSPVVTTTYKVKARCAANPSCFSSDVTGVTVTVNTISTAPTGISGTSILCAGNGTTLSVLGGLSGTNASFEWGTGNVVGANIIPGATAASYSVTPSATTTYWVRRLDPSPCNTVTGGVTQVVTVNTASMAPTAISGNNSLCLGTGTTLTATGGVAGTNCTYEWGTGNVIGSNIISGATSVSYTVTPSNNTTYWVRRIDPSPCNTITGGVTQDVFVNALPSAPSGLSNQNVCGNGNVTFTVNDPGIGFTIEWSTDGNTNNDGTGTGGSGNLTKTKAVTVGSPITEYARVSNSSTLCKSAWVSATGTADNAPGAVTISPSSSTICNGSSVALTSSGGITSSSVSYSSGTINLSIPDNSATGVNNTLTVSGIPSGATIDSVIVTLNITHPFDADVEVNLLAPNGQSINLIADEGGSGDNFTNTRITSDATKPAISSGSAPFTGTYRADLTGNVSLIGSVTTQTFSNLFSTPNGSWTIQAYDDGGTSIGTLNSWSIKIAYSQVNFTWTPSTGLNTTAGASVTATPTTTTTYTATSTVNGCSSSNSVTITVEPRLSGNLNVGTGQTYTSLTGINGLFSKINSCGLEGNLIVNIVSDMTEDGSVALNQWSGTYSLTIQPDGVADRLISGTVATNAMVRIDGADNVTFQNYNGRKLAFRNTSATASNTGATLSFDNGSSNCSVVNCILESNESSSTRGVIVIGSTGVNTNITVSGNEIRSSTGGTTGPFYNGIYSNSANNSSIVLSGNSIYSTSTGTTNQFGINLTAGNNNTITGNYIGGQSPAAGGSAWVNSGNVALFGIYVSVGNSVATGIQGNFIRNINMTNTGTSAYLHGIEVRGSSKVSVVGNTINDLTSSSGNTDNTGAASVIGISHNLSGDITGQNYAQNIIYNLSNNNPTATVCVTGMFYFGSIVVAGGTNPLIKNWIYDLTLSSSSSSSIIMGINIDKGYGVVTLNNMISLGRSLNTTAYIIYGVYYAAAQGANNFYYNTIYISGTPNSGAANTYDFYQFCAGANTRRSMLNNIFYNARTNSGSATGKHYNIRVCWYDSLELDYNNYAVAGGGLLAQKFNTDVTSLPTMQGDGIGKDANSLNVVPVFLSPINLRLDPYSNCRLDGRALSLAPTHTDDYDATTRSTGVSPNGPDMGADEFGYLNGLQWIGVISEDWHTEGNWCPRIPDSTTNVLILAGTPYQPVITQIAYAHDLTIGAGTSVSIHTNGRLRLYGDLVVDGSYNHDAGKLELVGPARQTLDTITADSVIISNPNGVLTHGNLTINKNLQLDNGLFITNLDTISVMDTLVTAVDSGKTLSYVYGNLRRAIGDTGLYHFPVGTSQYYQLASIRMLNNKHTADTGIAYLTAHFDSINAGCSDVSQGLPYINGTPVTELLNGGYWTIHPNISTYRNVLYEVTLNERGYTNAPDTATKLGVLKRDSCVAIWTAPGVHINSKQSINLITNTARAAKDSLLRFSDFGIGLNGGTPLPVELLFLEAESMNNSYIQVRWATATEINNYGFYLERSTDAEKWNQIGFIEGHGSTTRTYEYLYDDHDLQKNVRYYYRLKQTDYDGNYQFSDIVTAMISENEPKLTVIGFMPNPASSYSILYLRSSENQYVEVSIYNYLGQRIRTDRKYVAKARDNYVEFNLMDLASGTYTAVILCDKEVHTEKMIIVK